MKDKKQITNIYELKIDNNKIRYQWNKKDIKNIYLRFDYKQDIFIISSNFFISQKKIEKILQKNYIKILLKTRKPNSFEENSINIFGEKYKLKIIIDSKNSYMFFNDVIYLRLKSFKYKNIIIRKIIEEKYSPLIIERAISIAHQLTVNIQNVTCKWFKNKWGEYNRKEKSITLSLQLAKFNLKVIDSVIFHEIAHTFYFDHSPKFKNKLNELCPNNKELTKELNHFNDF